MSGANQTLLTQLNNFQTRRNALASATTPSAKTEQLSTIQALNADMAAAAKAATTESDTQGLLGELGTTRQQIIRLKEQREEAQEEADTAAARRASVEKREAVVSPHQLFLIDRPIKQWSVPTLLTLSIVFVLFGMRWLYLVYYGVGMGPVSFGLLTGFGQTLITAGTYLSDTSSGLGSTTSALRIPQQALRAPGQGITSQLGLKF
jgi:hypothetical protein